MKARAAKSLLLRSFSLVVVITFDSFGALRWVYRAPAKSLCDTNRFVSHLGAEDGKNAGTAKAPFSEPVPAHYSWYSVVQFLSGVPEC